MLLNVVFEVNHANVVPVEFPVIADVTPVGAVAFRKLLNDGVTFAEGLVRLTVTLHDPTVNPYDKFLRPLENIHWIAVVPWPLLEFRVRAEHAVIVQVLGRLEVTLTVILSVPVIALSSEHPKYTPDIAVIWGS